MRNEIESKAIRNQSEFRICLQGTLPNNSDAFETIGSIAQKTLVKILERDSFISESEQKQSSLKK